MLEITQINIYPLPMCTYEKLQRVDMECCSNRAAHISVKIYRDNDILLDDVSLAINSGKSVATLMLPVPKDNFIATWKLFDRDGNQIAEKVVPWNKPRELIMYAMVSSHTDIGLHNSQYIQRYNSVKFLDKACELCDQTHEEDAYNQYRYTMEGTWFWNNYGMDKGKNAATRVIQNYIAQGKIGVCTGVAGNHTQVYGLEELCRSTYERKRLFVNWGIQSETMSMIDNNGISMSIIQPYSEAGIKNIIFAPNQWNPLKSTIWKMDTEEYASEWNPNAAGGGSRIDVRYESALPMVFWWEDENKNRMLVWASTAYVSGGSLFGLFHYAYNEQSLSVMEEKMSRNLMAFEDKYPYDTWMFACYGDDQIPELGVQMSIKAWNEKWQWPKLCMMGNPDVPFNRLKEKYADQIPVLKGDITGGWYQHPVSTPELLAHKFGADRLLPVAETWSTVAALLDDKYEYPATNFRRAWDYLLFNDEHSYGTSGYQGRRVYETWMQHRDWINKAESIAQNEYKNALRSIANKITVKEDSVLVFNGTGQKRIEYIKCSDESKYALMEIPPLGYSAIPIKEFKATSIKRVKLSKAPVIENDYYKVVFAENGTIFSIFDKELNKELLDHRCDYRANEILYTKDNHKTFFIPEMASFEIVTEAKQITVNISGSLECLGAKIVQSVTLPSYEKRIDIDNQLYHVVDMVNQNRYLRYMYFAFPFAVDNARRLCHLNGAMAQYAKDITGHGTDVYMAVNEWCCVENDEYGVALMMLDSQLVEFDHIHPDKTDFGNPGDGSQIFVYAANDWLQMHTPGGSHLDYRFRYAITSYSGNFSKAKVPQMAERYTNPVQQLEVKKQSGTLKNASHSFMQLGEMQRLICLKRADDGDGIVVRIYGENDIPTITMNDGRVLSGERINIVEDIFRGENNIDCGFLTYRLGKDIVQIKEKEDACFQNSEGVPAPVGSVYTGLITEPCAAAGEESGLLYLLWGANIEENFSHYNLYRSEVPGFVPDNSCFVATVAPEEYRCGRFVDKGLKQHTRYYYRVCAVNNNGQCSEMSNEFSGITKEELGNEE